MPVIPSINKGACVGVLYKNNKGILKVHNGKLTQKEPSHSANVVLKHVGNPKTMKIDNFSIPRKNVLSILKTPDYSPPCTTKPGLIEAGACVAVKFKTGPNTFDVKNGRFLYGITSDGKVSCLINPKKPPSTIVYAHYNIVSQGSGHQSFVSQIVTRKNVTEVKRVVL